MQCPRAAMNKRRRGIPYGWSRGVPLAARRPALGSDPYFSAYAPVNGIGVITSTSTPSGAATMKCR
jgi:hypothetical protein